MLEILMLLMLFGFGAGVGFWVRARIFNHQPALEPVVRKEITEAELRQTMQNALDAITLSMYEIYPERAPHADDCDCVQCEIAYGPVADRAEVAAAHTKALTEKGEAHSYHPDYVHSLQGKMKTQQAEIKRLRAEIDKRDKDRAADYDHNAKSFRLGYEAGLRGDDAIEQFGGVLVRTVPKRGVSVAKDGTRIIDGPLPGHYSTPNGDGSYTMHKTPVVAEPRPAEPKPPLTTGMADF